MSRLVQDVTENQLSYSIIGAAMAVHNSLGPGLKEEVYERALAGELRRRGIEVRRQAPVDVWHAGEIVGRFYLDLLVEGPVVVEVKALSHQLTNDELAQVINYLRASGASLGLLFNFGRRRLQYRRVFPGAGDERAVERLGRDNVKRTAH